MICDGCLSLTELVDGDGGVMSIRPEPWPEIPEATARAARAAARRGPVPLAMRVRDELGELFADELFAEAFGTRGRLGWSPGRLALVTVLQLAENLTDRGAEQRVRFGMDWKYALGMELDNEGFDHTVLSEFRARVAAHDLAERVLDVLLAACTDKGLLAAGGKQRTDSTHVLAAVRDLNRLELAGESVRACLEALAVAAPDWLANTLDTDGWGRRYAARVGTWRLPASETKRAELAVAYGSDGFRLLEAVHGADAPGWLRQLPAVEVLRVVLLQNYTRTVTGGREAVKRREADTDGLPPGHLRLTSPYDPDARWGVKRDSFWDGYKVHLTETCDAGDPNLAGSTDGEQPPAVQRPNLVTNVATTDATVPDAKMTEPIHQHLAQRDLLPGEHYVDSGYPSVELLVSSEERYGVTLVTPLLADTSPQARTADGFRASAFTINFDTQQATCPQGHLSAWWSPCTQRGADTIVVKFPATVCRPCPVRARCTTAKRGGRQLTVRPRGLHDALQAARAAQGTRTWQARYALRAGVEGTIRQAVAVTGIRHARYRGLPKTHLEHVFSAVALNLIRLDAWWNSHPLDRTRTSHFTRLHLVHAA